MMSFLFLLLYISHAEPVPSQGENKLILRPSRGDNPCEGYVQVYHENEWGYVGDYKWNTNIEKVVCKSAGCGEPTSSDERVSLPKGSKVWLNELTCTGEEKYLWECDHIGWGRSPYRKNTVKKIKCSDTINISLDRFKCAGAVQYSKNGKTGYFCSDGWGEDKAERLCKSLGCGKLEQIPPFPWLLPKDFDSSDNMRINCPVSTTEDNLWQCATQEKCKNPASVICADHERLVLKGNSSNVCSGQLHIEEGGTWKGVSKNSIKIEPDKMCQQMYCGSTVTHDVDANNTVQLSCSAKVQVSLRVNNKMSNCYGTVVVSVNDTYYPVCGKEWTKKNAEVVCSELKCGKVISSDVRRVESDATMDFVQCSGGEASLWHCLAKHEINSPFKCSSSPYIVCGGSLNMRLRDGPGKCAGRLEIQHENQWLRVRDNRWTIANSDKICNLMKCGNAAKSIIPDKFSPGSGPILDLTFNCIPSYSHISDCVSAITTITTASKTVEITCKKHMMVLLKGNTSCSGDVSIEHHQKSYWLSGSEKMWNQKAANVVCRQKHCGEATVFERKDVNSADMKKVWQKAYSCTPNKTSLFDCVNSDDPPANYSDTIASVTCSKNTTVKLHNKCWGNVTVCVEGECGGVCANTWTEDMSLKLCKSWHCGNIILKPIDMQSKPRVTIKSLHCTNETDTLDKCNFVRSGSDSYCETKPAVVVCSGSAKPKFDVSRDKCSGNLKVSYQDQWLPVCKGALKDTAVQSTICKELGCGEGVGTLDFVPKLSDNQRVISNIKCDPNSQSLAECQVNSSMTPCTPVGLQCSDWRKMKLEHTLKACSGDVFVYAKGDNITAVSTEGWAEEEGKRLCQDLKCGSYIGMEAKPKISQKSFFESSFNCKGVERPKNIWDCERSSTATENRKQLYVHCQDEPVVTLSHGCYGELKMRSDGVCGDHWNDDYATLVCQEQNCSIAAGHDSNEQHTRDLVHVSCDDSDFKLGQCKTFSGTCTKGLVSVYCTSNIQFNTTEKCGGLIKVKYRDRWDYVCPLKTFSVKFKDILCEKLGCIKTINYTQNMDTPLVNLETKLECNPNNKYINQCVRKEFCKNVKPAEIYCKGYEIEKEKPEEVETPQLLVLGIVLGVVFLLVLILLFVFLRVWTLKKRKNDKGVMLKLSMRSQVEVENGECNDDQSKANETTDCGNFSSEANVVIENDTRSISSYDDIDKADEAAAQPLTSHSSSGSGEHFMNKELVTYEVDDPQENYDDIAANPETEREVDFHNSGDAAPASNTESPPGSEQANDDYLKPDQDG